MEKKELKIPENIKITKIIKSKGEFENEDGVKIPFTVYKFKLENTENHTFIELKPTPAFKDYVADVIEEEKLF